MAAFDEYYIRIRGEQKGPYSYIELKRLYDRNLLAPETLYWRDGLEQWESVAQLCDTPVVMTARKLPHAKVILLAALAIAVGIISYFGPLLITGWKETNQHEFIPESAYWRARGELRDMVTTEERTISFERFDPTMVTLTGQSEMTVLLTCTVYNDTHNSKRAKWRVTLRFDSKLEKWFLVSAQQAGA